MDYVIKRSLYNKDMSINLVICVEDFEVENKVEGNLNRNFEDVLCLPEILSKIPAILSIYSKLKLKNSFDDEFIPTFTAKNFINNSFIHYPLEESNSFIDGALTNNKYFVNYLVKRKEGVQSQVNSFDEEKENAITNKLNHFDYRAFYEVLPSVQEKIGHKFVAIPSSLEFNKIQIDVI